MRKPSSLSRLCVLSVAFVAASMILVGPAQATWYWVHGHNGHIEYKDRFTDPNRFEFGWGLDFLLNAGTNNWVHFAVPTIVASTKGVRYVRVHFLTGSADAWVSTIHVYNGSTLVKELTGTWSDGWKMVTVDLDSVRSFSRGLGVSVEIKAGVESMSHRFVFDGVGANFVNK